MKKGICVVCGAPFESRWYHQKTCSPRCGNTHRSNKCAADFARRKNRLVEIWNTLKVANRGQYIADLIFVSNRTVEAWYYNPNRAIPRSKLERLEAKLWLN